MTPNGSVTAWFQELAQGDRAAAVYLWQRYFSRLVAVARNRLRNVPRPAADEEDVALSVFDSFCRGAERGQFPNLEDREDLWALLMTITARKAFHLLRDQRRLKRGGADGPPAAADWEEALSQEPSPELAAQMTEEYLRLLHRLPDEELRRVALWKMENFSVDDIAERLGCSSRSVKRKTQLIREIWEEEIQP
jgi:DNA-directed RNA polymerase specialized sigma24 family protein